MFVCDFAPQGSANGQIGWPRGVCFTVDDEVLITDTSWCCVHQFRLDGTFMRRIGARGDSDGQFRLPSDIAVDAHNNILVSDYISNRVQMLRSDGAFVRTVANKPDVKRPRGACVLSNGRIAVCDQENHCVNLWT
jgi:hypothetical protein